MSEEIRIEFTRFSAFYSPLIAAIAGGFLKDEGFAPKYTVSPPGKSAIVGLKIAYSRYTRVAIGGPKGPEIRHRRSGKACSY